MFSFRSAKGRRIVFLENPFAVKRKGEEQPGREKSPKPPGLSPPGPSRQPEDRRFYKATARLTTGLQPGAQYCGVASPPSKPSARPSPVVLTALSLSTPAPPVPWHRTALGLLGTPRGRAGPPFPAPPRTSFHFSPERRGSAAHARGVPRRVSLSPKQRSPGLSHSVAPYPAVIGFAARLLVHPHTPFRHRHPLSAAQLTNP